MKSYSLVLCSPVLLSFCTWQNSLPFLAGTLKTAAMRYFEAFVAIASYQFETTVTFYQALLEQSAVPLLPGRYAEWTLAGGLKLGIFSPHLTHRDEFQADGAGAISLCLEVEDLDHAIAALTRLGYPPPGEIQSASHGREVYAYDPEGNRIILHQRWTEATRPQ
jgi:predicted enzyme related to lactoylglutathione lyase